MPILNPSTADRAVLLDQVLPSGLHGRDCALLGNGEVDQLPGAPGSILGGNIKVVAQQEQERLTVDKVAGAPHGMAIAQRLVLDGKPEPLGELAHAVCLSLSPLNAFVRRSQVGGKALKVATIINLVPRSGDDANLLDPALHRLLGDDLEHRLGQAIAVDERLHGFLNRVERRILPGPTPRRRDDRPGDPQRFNPPWKLPIHRSYRS